MISFATYVLSSIGTSDHCQAVTTLLPKQRLKAKKTLCVRWDYNNARRDEMKEVLLHVDWCSELSGSDVYVVVHRFSEVLLYALKKHIPKIQYFPRPDNKLWYIQPTALKVHQRKALLSLLRVLGCSWSNGWGRIQSSTQFIYN